MLVATEQTYHGATFSMVDSGVHREGLLSHPQTDSPGCRPALLGRRAPDHRVPEVQGDGPGAWDD